MKGVEEKRFSGPFRPAAPCGLAQAARGYAYTVRAINYLLFIFVYIFIYYPFKNERLCK